MAHFHKHPSCNFSACLVVICQKIFVNQVQYIVLTTSLTFIVFLLSSSHITCSWPCLILSASGPIPLHSRRDSIISNLYCLNCQVIHSCGIPTYKYVLMRCRWRVVGGYMTSITSTGSPEDLVKPLTIPNFLCDLSRVPNCVMSWTIWDWHTLISRVTYRQHKQQAGSRQIIIAIAVRRRNAPLYRMHSFFE